MSFVTYTPGLYSFNVNDFVLSDYTIKLKDPNKMQLSRQTAQNLKELDAQYKADTKNRKAAVLVDAVTYSGDPYAILTVTNGLLGDRNQYVRIELSPSDLRDLQDLVFKARQQIHKVTSGPKNPQPEENTSDSPW